MAPKKKFNEKPIETNSSSKPKAHKISSASATSTTTRPLPSGTAKSSTTPSTSSTSSVSSLNPKQLRKQADELVNQGIKQIENSNISAGKKSLQDALKLLPQHQNAWYNLVLLETEAIEQEAESLNSTEDSDCGSLMSALVGRFQDNIKEFDRVIALDTSKRSEITGLAHRSKANALCTTYVDLLKKVHLSRPSPSKVLSSLASSSSSAADTTSSAAKTPLPPAVKIPTLSFSAAVKSSSATSLVSTEMKTSSLSPCLALKATSSSSSSAPSLVVPIYPTVEEVLKIAETHFDLAISIFHSSQELDVCLLEKAQMQRTSLELAVTRAETVAKTNVSLNEVVIGGEILNPILTLTNSLTSTLSAALNTAFSSDIDEEIIKLHGESLQLVWGCIESLLERIVSQTVDPAGVHSTIALFSDENIEGIKDIYDQTIPVLSSLKSLFETDIESMLILSDLHRLIWKCSYLITCFKTDEIWRHTKPEFMECEPWLGLLASFDGVILSLRSAMDLVLRRLPALHAAAGAALRTINENKDLSLSEYIADLADIFFALGKFIADPLCKVTRFHSITEEALAGVANTMQRHDNVLYEASTRLAASVPVVSRSENLFVRMGKSSAIDGASEADEASHSELSSIPAEAIGVVMDQISRNFLRLASQCFLFAATTTTSTGHTMGSIEDQIDRLTLVIDCWYNYCCTAWRLRAIAACSFGFQQIAKILVCFDLQHEVEKCPESDLLATNDSFSQLSLGDFPVSSEQAIRSYIANRKKSICREITDDDDLAGVTSESWFPPVLTLEGA